MAKLKQKNWMTISEAAGYLSTVCESGPVSGLDVVQYAIDGDIGLSLRTTRGTLSPIWTAPIEAPGEYDEKEVGSYCGELAGAAAEERENRRFMFFNLDDVGGVVARGGMQDVLLPGIWDIPRGHQWGGYLVRLWSRYKKKEFDPENPLIAEATDDHWPPSDGEVLLVDGARWSVFALPTHLIPEDSYLVVRRPQLERLFEEKDQARRPDELGTKERRTYLRVLRALCEEHKDIDLSKHSTAATQIMAMADAKGLAIPGKRTLESLLREARDLED